LVSIGVSEPGGIDKNYPTQFTLKFATRGFQSDGLYAEGTWIEGLVNFHSPTAIATRRVSNFVEDVIYELRSNEKHGLSRNREDLTVLFPAPFPPMTLVDAVSVPSSPTVASMPTRR
jgi:hypothetical protein